MVPLSMSAVSLVLPEPLASAGQQASWAAMDVMVQPFCLAASTVSGRRSRGRPLD